MKKIIAAFDGLKYATSTRDYAIAIALQTETHLVGVFLEDPLYTSYKMYDLIEDKGVSSEKLNMLEANDLAKRQEAVNDFEKACQQSGLKYSIHHDHKTAILELKHECTYADMLIINAEETLSHYAEKIPTRFITELLIDAHCPVLVVPNSYKPINKIALLYDGEPSSVHAIKMFSYILPGLKQYETSLITVKSYNANLHIPDNKLVKELMKRHYPNANFTVLEGLAEDEIIHHINESKENSLIVLGAYKRGAISRWMKESMADILMKEMNYPLFIAHK